MNPEQGVGLVGAALQLGVELDAHEPGVVGQLHDLHQPFVGGLTARIRPAASSRLAVEVVELIAVAVALVDDFLR